MIENYDALIFDCDGVLVNSEEIAQEIELEMLAKVGMHYQRDEYVHKYAGTSEPEFIAALRSESKKRVGKELPSKFFDEMMVAIDLAYEDRLQQLEGASALASVWPKFCAVASSSSMELLMCKLRMVELDGFFSDHIYSAEQVGRGKPHPAVFLHAAKSLSVDPERCIVIEDSVNGVIAARRAGMMALGFIGGGHCLKDHRHMLMDAGADDVFESHAEIEKILKLAQ